jgi:hypothetical protein
MRQGQRRGLVVATYLGFTAFLAVLYRGSTTEPRWQGWLGPLALLLFAATALAFVRVVTSPGFAADTVDRQLDERQRLVRDHAYRSAYYGLTLLFGALSLVVMYAAGDDAGWSAMREAALLLPWLTFVPGSLPSAIVAWTEPDPPEDP